ncbi:MAG TPA: hypothetical protein ENN20_04000 [Candidatus Marinimicrobia bacterium]|nr:hypothetical protein [Candidatus Neomarinimicrobiota bacterium]
MNSTAETIRDQNRMMLRQSGKLRMMLWILLIVIVGAIMVIMFLLRDDRGNPIPVSSRQLIIVRTPSWTASKGIMQCFEHRDNNTGWVPVGQKVNIILGRNGMGWGEGLHRIPGSSVPIKREGDGKSPAGVFRLGAAFGFPAIEDIGNLKIPYRSVNEFLECVDDVESRYYNQLVAKDRIESVDWNSSERIHRAPNAYHYSVVVEHNTVDTQKGAGSCIFLHCVSVRGDSTAGCTTLSRAEMGNILRWLDSDDDPILVQLPETEYIRLKDKWGLPEF